MIAPSPHNDARYVALLQCYDEELRRGALSGSTRDESGSHETPPQEGNVLDCLHLLERVWPRAARASVESPVEQIGRFRIERILGHGGFGIVYLATDPALRRQVALKVPRLHALSQPALVDRFRREARAAAGLDHPHIVPVYEAGEAADALYIASAYCPGPNLGQWLKEHPGGTAPHTAALIVTQLADAVAYSHSRGVLHRDIKPGNVLLVPHEIGDGSHFAGTTSPQFDRDGKMTPVPFFYTPRLSDFGLAKVLEEAAADGTLNVAAETVAGAMLGTPAYMAPEQAADGSQPIGPEADVYALGAVLYELLTGRPPFQGPSVVDLLDQVRHADPVPVRRLRRDVPRALETICHKCLEKSPARRYAAAAELRADLERFRRGEPVRARPAGPFELAWKGMRRRPVRTAVIVLGTLALLGVGTQRSLHTAAVEGLNADLARTNTQLQEALTATQRSERAAREVAYASDIHLAGRARQEGDFVQFEEIINRYRDGSPLAEYRGLEWHYLERLTRSEGRELLRLPQAVYGIVADDDRQRLTIVGQDAAVHIVDAVSGRILDEWDTGQKEVNAVAYSPDGATLWTSGDDGTIRRWDVETHAETECIVANTDAVYDLVYRHYPDPERCRLISCGREPVIRLWHGGICHETLAGHTDWVEDLELHPDGRRLISVSQDGTARVWDLAEQRLLHTLAPDTGKMRHAAISQDGNLIATCSNQLHLWDADSGALLFTQRTVDTPHRVCFGFHDERLCVADQFGALHLYQLQIDEVSGVLAGLSPAATWRGHVDRPYVLVRSGNGEAIVSGGSDGRVGRWNSGGWSTAETRRIPLQHPSQCTFVSGVPRLMIVASYGLSVCDCEAPAPRGDPLADSYIWGRVAASPRGDLVAGLSRGRPTVLRTWRLGDRSAVARLELPNSEQWHDILSFSPDGLTLAACADSRVCLLDPYTGVVKHWIEIANGWTARLSPTVPDVLVIQTANTLRAWHWPTDAVLWETPDLPQRPTEIAFSPDGRLIANIGLDRVVRLWDSSTGSLLRELRGHRTQVCWVDISPDGRTVASADRGGTLKLWHRATGQYLCDVPWDLPAIGPSDELSPFGAFSPDARWLAVSSMGSKVVLQLLPLRQ